MELRFSSSNPHDLTIYEENKPVCIIKPVDVHKNAEDPLGIKGGRPKKLNEEKVALAKKLYANPKNTVEYICKILGVSKPSFYAYLNERR